MASRINLTGSKPKDDENDTPENDEGQDTNDTGDAGDEEETEPSKTDPKGALMVKPKGRGPATLKALKSRLVCPETKVRLELDEETYVEGISNWLQCQIDAGLVEVVNTHAAPKKKSKK
jgi:hypothetical protein